MRVVSTFESFWDFVRRRLCPWFNYQSCEDLRIHNIYVEDHTKIYTHCLSFWNFGKYILVEVVLLCVIYKTAIPPAPFQWPRSFIWSTWYHCDILCSFSPTFLHCKCFWSINSDITVRVHELILALCSAFNSADESTIIQVHAVISTRILKRASFQCSWINLAEYL